MKRKSSYLANNILKDYKREQAMKKKATRLQKLSDDKTEIKGEKKQCF